MVKLHRSFYTVHRIKFFTIVRATDWHQQFCYQILLRKWFHTQEWLWPNLLWLPFSSSPRSCVKFFMCSSFPLHTPSSPWYNSWNHEILNWKPSKSSTSIAPFKIRKLSPRERKWFIFYFHAGPVWAYLHHPLSLTSGCNEHICVPTSCLSAWPSWHWNCSINKCC